MPMLTLNRKAGAAGSVCAVAAIIAIVLSSGQVRTNQRGLELIGNAEGCRRDPYTCPAGVLTNGIGNTHNVQPGVKLTDQQIADTWQRNILDAEACVNRYGNGRNLSDNTFSAAVSVTFRAGCGNMRNSTMFTLFREGPVAYKSACNQFTRWVWGGSKVLPGLVKRADDEKALCMDGVK